MRWSKKDVLGVIARSIGFALIAPGVRLMLGSDTHFDVIFGIYCGIIYMLTEVFITIIPGSNLAKRITQFVLWIVAIVLYHLLVA